MQITAKNIIDNDCMSWVDKTKSELEYNWKMYACLTVMQGKIRVCTSVVKNVRALIKWVKDRGRTRQYPSTDIFHISGNNVLNLISRMTTYEQLINNTNDKAKTSNQKQFKETMKWIDWRYYFINLLRTQLGRNGIPLG